MNTYENAIFVSYAWGGESERTVDEVEKALAAHGLSIVRDKKELDFKGSIQAFEQRIGQGQAIILVISDKYLRSPHCMYELVEAADNRDLRARIFPIVLEDAKIYSAIDRLEYIQYWDAKITELNQAIKNVDVVANLQGVTHDLNLYTRIRAEIAQLTDLLRDMNTLTPKIHAESGYSTLIEAIERTLTGGGQPDAHEIPAQESQSQPAVATAYNAQASGGSAIAQGNNSMAVGAGGMHIGGSVGGDMVTGSKIEQKAGDGAIQIGQARDVKIDQGPTFNIKGDIKAGRDVVMGDQTNYNSPPPAQVQTSPEFVAELNKLQMQISTLIQQSELNKAQLRNLQAVQEQVAEATDAAQKPQPDGSQVQQTLNEAKDTMDLLSGSLTSALGLGTAIAGLIEISIKLFGG